jgi:hypothetical protein
VYASYLPSDQSTQVTIGYAIPPYRFYTCIQFHQNQCTRAVNISQVVRNGCNSESGNSARPLVRVLLIIFPLLYFYPCNAGHQCICKVVQLSKRLPTAVMDVTVNLGILHGPLYACCQCWPPVHLQSCTAITMPTNCCNRCNSKSGDLTQPIVRVLPIIFPLLCCYPCNVSHQCVCKVVRLS